MTENSPKSSWTELWLKEDYWAIWLGFILLLAGCVLFLPNPPEGMETKIRTANATMDEEAARAPFKTIEYYEAQDIKSGLRARNSDLGKQIALFFKQPQTWKNNPLNSFFMGSEQADSLNNASLPALDVARKTEADALTEARAAQAAAEAAGFGDEALNQTAESRVDAWHGAKSDLSAANRKTNNKPFNIIPSLIGLMVAMGLFFAVGIKAMGKDLGGFLKGFPLVFFIAVVAYMLAAQVTMKHYGVGDAAWAIALGMLISNTVGTPGWAKPALEVEYYIKTGLVLLGGELLISKIISIGLPGICVAWLVTPTVLVLTFIFGQKVLKIESKTLNMVISADMSVCGTSAAIAASAACRAKKEELTLAIGLSLVFTSIMMVAMPAVIKATGMPYILGGAWMGGTIDATGAVAAAGAFLSEEALYVAATIKMIQNMLIGVIAFAIAVYWSMRVEAGEGQRVGLMEIWYRFPKFILGFLAASIIFSVIYSSMGTDIGYTMIDQGVLRGFSRLCRDWFFTLAFVSIGLATNFKELAHQFKGGKPFILYACGQGLNLTLTLIMAYIMFYLVFPDITAAI